MRLSTLYELGAAKRGKPRDMGKPPVGQPFPLPAPSLGMNSRDSVSALDVREARDLCNMLCDGGKVIIRKGRSALNTLGGVVGSMHRHAALSADIVLAAADGKIYDATGAVADELASGYTRNLWSMAQLNDTTIAVNGADTPFAFDGSTVAATGISGSGLTLTTLRTVHKVRNRLWFTEAGSANVWYLGAAAITGTATEFQLSQVTGGGYCVGVYDYRGATVFVMSTGECVSYQGDVQTDFAISGNWQASKPVGYHPGLTIGGDLVIMTESGPLTFEAIVAGVTFDSQQLAQWGKVAPSWAADFVLYGSNEGWSAIYAQGLAIFTIPTVTGESKQWVFNTKNKTWVYWTGLNCAQICEADGQLFLGMRGVAEVQTLSGSTDDGDAIVATIRGGFFVPFGDGVDGVFTLARLNCRASGLVTAQLQLDVNYNTTGISAPEVPISNSGSGPWDGPWDGPWGVDGQAQLRWSKVRGFGRAVAGVVQFHSSADRMEYFGLDVIGARAGSV